MPRKEFSGKYTARMFGSTLDSWAVFRTKDVSSFMGRVHPDQAVPIRRNMVRRQAQVLAKVLSRLDKENEDAGND